MVYWVKCYENIGKTYTEDGYPLGYLIKTYEGPFRTLTDLHNFLDERRMNSPVEVLEFET